MGAEAKALSTNSLRNEFQLNHPQWIRTDPNIFYSSNQNLFLSCCSRTAANFSP